MELLFCAFEESLQVLTLNSLTWCMNAMQATQLNLPRLGMKSKAELAWRALLATYILLHRAIEFPKLSLRLFQGLF